jgi:hypothetical protein
MNTTSQEQPSRTFVFVVDPSGKEITVTAASEKAAHRAAWESLTDDEKNATACLECVDETE